MLHDRKIQSLVTNLVDFSEEQFRNRDTRKLKGLHSGINLYVHTNKSKIPFLEYTLQILFKESSKFQFDKFPYLVICVPRPENGLAKPYKVIRKRLDEIGFKRSFDFKMQRLHHNTIAGKRYNQEKTNDFLIAFNDLETFMLFNLVSKGQIWTSEPVDLRESIKEEKIVKVQVA